MRVFVESYGCAQNQGEGREIERTLAHGGHSVVPGPAGSDVVVLVTCGVIGATERRMVRRWEVLSSLAPRLIVTGCLVPLRTELFRGPGRARTAFLPIREQHRLPELISSESGPAPVSGSPLEEPPPRLTEEVVIAQGCTSACAYCFSRLARGRLESVPAHAVIERVRAAVARGAREVRLTGLDTAVWGEDLPGEARLPELIDAVSAEVPEGRVRIGMMSPQSLRPILDRHLDALAAPPVYRFLHLPVQSGSDAILGTMHREYTVAEFRAQVAEARRRLPDVHLATDLIVGYPGETEDDHRATEELLEELAPETVNVTRFSPRPGTPAARRPLVPPRVAKRRSRSLALLRQRVGRVRLERWIGERVRGRVLEYGPGGSSVVRLENYLPVVLEERPPLGASVDVRIDGARSTFLLGRTVDARF